jgi:DNA-binding NtrC family response regulator
VRQLTSLVLESLGYQVTACDRPEEALGYFAKSNRRTDLLVTDVIMPGMNGCDLAEAAQKLQPGLRVLFTSGYTSHAILEKHILEPGMPFLQKPFSTQSLAKKVREALEGKES